ncbi:hypothetical protein [Tepidanaerobacter acetatoxydans]|nr:hypothetical protein [Tepidanaerobacter acetatoxydans]
MKYKPSEERVGVLRDEITARSLKRRSGFLIYLKKGKDKKDEKPF